MATNFNTNPFGIYAHPFSGSLKTGSAVDVINFINSSPFFTSSKQADAGSIAIEYSKLGQSGSGAGAAADIVFKVAGKEYANKNATEVLRISATGSSNEARIGIGMGKSDTVDSILHVKGETLIDGDFKIKSGSETVTINKDDLKDLVQGKAVSDSSGTKNAARGGLTQTFAANALVNLADSSTLVKANESGKLELKANNLTLVEVDATDANIPVVNIGDKPAGKVLMTGSLEVTGSNVTFDVEDLLTLLGNFGQTGSFAVSGSSDFTGDVNMDGVVTVNDLLTVVAGISSTGSTDLSGSVNVDGDTFISGAFEVGEKNNNSKFFKITASIPHMGVGVNSIHEVRMGDLADQGNSTKLLLNDKATHKSVTVSGSLIVKDSITANDDITANGKVLLSAGTSTAPSLASAGDTDTGIYFPAPNNIAVQASGGLTEVSVNPLEISLTTQTGGSNTITATTDTFRLSSSLSVSSSQVDFTNLPTSDPGIAGRLYQTSSAAMGMTAGKQVVLISA